MVRIILIAAIAFLAGLGCGFLAQKHVGGVAEGAAHAADLAAIVKLHQADVAATLTQDPGALTTLWSDDGVNLGFPGPPVVGIKDMGEAYAKFRAGYPDFKVLKYAPNITDVEIADGWAIEVGDFAATYRVSPKDDPVNANDKGMRVLKRQSDGSWKFAVVGLK
jgi:hypothetical protein